MNVAVKHNALPGNSIVTFGREIFSRVGASQPSAFNKNYWSGRMMEWSMTRPAFKTNLFRLVDVLPSLRSSDQIAEHVTQYLATEGKAIHPFVGWAMRINPHSLKAKLASFVVKKSVREMAAQFIAGEDPKSALPRLREIRRNGMSFTADLLGEFCVSEPEAAAYLNRYLDALSVFGAEVPQWVEGAPLVEGHPGESTPVCISVKLSALYSQCNALNYTRTVSILAERLSTIARKAREVNAILYVDAEDSGNNPMIYAAFKKVFGSPEFRTFPYPGMVVQAYARGAEGIVRDLLDFAKKRGAPIAIRLVKGAYWDSETIIAQQNNWPSPLFEKKESSDANFEYLSRLLIDNRTLVMPAFGSHNIRSLSHACCYAAQRGLSPSDFELQMLYGMADPIARAFRDKGYLVRLYVPLGEMLPGMGYLVRRLLENTSNESFLRHTFFEDDEVEKLLEEPRLRD